MIHKEENPDFLNDYLSYLSIVRGRSDRTVQEYYLDLCVFFRYLLYVKNETACEVLEEISIKELNLSHLKKVDLKFIYDYAAYLKTERGNNGRSISRKMSAIRSFFRYMTINVHLLEENPAQNLEMPSTGKALPHYLTLEQSLELLESVKTTMQERDFCILTLFLNCGMRLSELVGINLGDIDFSEQTLRVHGKGNKERIIFLNTACMDALRTYLEVRGNPKPNAKTAFFLSRNHTRISKRRVQQIVETALAQAGLSNMGFSTHKLRHTAATLMYQYGEVDTITLKDVLGHESIATTEIYTHLSDENRRNAMESNPLSVIHKRNKKNSSKEGGE